MPRESASVSPSSEIAIWRDLEVGSRATLTVGVLGAQVSPLPAVVGGLGVGGFGGAQAVRVAA